MTAPKLLIGIDRQHSGQVGRYIDSMGAANDLDDDGKIEIHELESILTARYGLHIEIALREKGYHVVPISDGSYKERALRMNRYASLMGIQAIYLALHANAGGGDYSVFFYDHRSAKGRDLAEFIRSEMEEAIPEIANHKIRKASPADWTRNAYGTIRHVAAPVAICCEPFFIDHRSHRRIINPKGLERVGRAIARGIDRWIRQLQTS